jgi:hypothetical protein
MQNFSGNFTENIVEHVRIEDPIVIFTKAKALQNFADFILQ